MKRWGLVLKVLKYLILGFLGCIFAFFFCFHAMFSVGYANLSFSQFSMKPFAEKAYAYPNPPGQNTLLSLQGDKLVPAKHGLSYFRTGSVYLHHTQSDKRFVTFDTGGGHLGKQGYVYAENSTAEEVHQVAFSGYEGMAVRALFGAWYGYDSLEE